ncbi:MAG: nuclear transport factor 2 family protein [Myxococcota bacterium]
MAPARKRSRSKSARGKKGTRRTVRKRAPAKKKAARKKKAAVRKKPTRRKTAARKKPAAPSLAALAAKIIRLTQGPSFGPVEIRELYNEDAASIEASGAVAQGHAELEEKMKGWEQMAAGMTSEAKHVWTGPDTVCIEWASTVTMRDGRTVQLHEVAVHEIKDGKIQSERYYYDPSALAPPAETGGLPPTA